jgi:hypothetical protein
VLPAVLPPVALGAPADSAVPQLAPSSPRGSARGLAAGGSSTNVLPRVLPQSSSRGGSSARPPSPGRRSQVALFVFPLESVQSKGVVYVRRVMPSPTQCFEDRRRRAQPQIYCALLSYSKKRASCISRPHAAPAPTSTRRTPERTCSSCNPLLLSLPQLLICPNSPWTLDSGGWAALLRSTTVRCEVCRCHETIRCGAVGEQRRNMSNSRSLQALAVLWRASDDISQHFMAELAMLWVGSVLLCEQPENSKSARV